MKSDRYFYSATAALILVITIVGFFAFYTTGHGAGGRVIAELKKQGVEFVSFSELAK